MRTEDKLKKRAIKIILNDISYGFNQLYKDAFTEMHNDYIKRELSLVLDICQNATDKKYYCSKKREINILKNLVGFNVVCSTKEYSAKELANELLNISISNFNKILAKKSHKE